MYCTVALAQFLSCFSSLSVMYFTSTGFAVVKRGKNKRTGLDVAVKVQQVKRYLRSFPCCFVFCIMQISPQFFPNIIIILPIQIVDKTRYAAGDNSLHREIEVLFRVC